MRIFSKKKNILILLVLSANAGFEVGVAGFGGFMKSSVKAELSNIPKLANKKNAEKNANEKNVKTNEEKEEEESLERIASKAPDSDELGAKVSENFSYGAFADISYETNGWIFGANAGVFMINPQSFETNRAFFHKKGYFDAVKAGKFDADAYNKFVREKTSNVLSTFMIKQLKEANGSLADNIDLVNTCVKIVDSPIWFAGGYLGYKLTSRFSVALGADVLMGSAKLHLLHRFPHAARTLEEKTFDLNDKYGVFGNLRARVVITSLWSVFAQIGYIAWLGKEQKIDDQFLSEFSRNNALHIRFGVVLGV